jgi:hypothetical protein
MTLALADALLHFHPFRVVEGEVKGCMYLDCMQPATNLAQSKRKP